MSPRKDPRDGLLPSVSTIKNVLSKDLIGWAAWMVAREAVLNQAAWRDLPTAVDAIEYLRGAADRSRDDAAAHGTNVHAIVETIAKGGDGGDSIEAQIAHDFIDHYGFRVAYAEYGVLNKTYGYGGAGDLLGHIDGEMWQIDLKTSNSLDISKKVDDWELQQAAYAHAEVIVDKDAALVEVKFGANSQHWYRPDAEVLGVLPAVERVGILHIPRSQPEEWKLVELRADKPEFAAFLAAKAVFDWKRYHKTQPQPQEVPAPQEAVALSDLKLFIWEGNGISEAYHDDGTLVVLAGSPEQARSIAQASARAAADGSIVDEPAMWTDGLGWSDDYAKKDVPNDAIHREPDRVVDLDQPQVVAFNGGGYD